MVFSIFLLSAYLDYLSCLLAAGWSHVTEDGKGWRLMWHMATPGLALYNFPHSPCPPTSVSSGGCWPATKDPLMDSKGLGDGIPSCSASNCTAPAPSPPGLGSGPERDPYCIRFQVVRLAVRLCQFTEFRRDKIKPFSLSVCEFPYVDYFAFLTWRKVMLSLRFRR